MQRFQLNFKSLFQLIGMLITGLIFIIGLIVLHKKDYDTSYDYKLDGKEKILDEKRKVIQMEKDLNHAKEVYKYKMEHPTPIPQTPLRKYGYGGWTIVDANNTPKNKFGIVEKGKRGQQAGQAPVVKPLNMSGTGANIYNSPVQKKTQKMVRYEDWVDEVEVLQNPKPEDSIIKIEPPKPGE